MKFQPPPDEVFATMLDEVKPKHIAFQPPMKCLLQWEKTDAFKNSRFSPPPMKCLLQS